MDENNKPIDPEKILNEETEPKVEAPQPPVEENAPEQDVVAQAPAYEEPQPVKEQKPKSRKTLIAAAAAVVAVIVIVIIAVLASGSPLSKVVKGARNSAESLQKNGIVALLTDVSKGGSMEVVCDLEEMGMPVEGNASVKLYSSADPALALVAGLEVDGSSVLDATVVGNTNDLAIASKALLGDKAYGISLKNFTKNFEDSAFGPDGDYSLGVELETIQDSLDSLKNSEKLSKDAQKVLDKMVETALKSLKSNAEISKSTEVLTFAGEDVKTTAVSVAIDGATCAALLEDMVNFMRTDKSFESLLTENADYFMVLMNEFVGGYYDDPDEFVDEFFEALDMIDEEMDDLAEELEDADIDITLTFYVTKSGTMLVGMAADVDVDGDKTKMSVYAGPSFEELNEINFRIDDVKGSYVVEENSKTSYVGVLKVREGTDTILKGEINWDKKKGDLEAEITDEWGDSYGFEGSLSTSSKTTTLTIESIYSDGDSMDLAVDVILKNSDKMPSVPKYTDILTMSADDLEDLVYDMSDVIEELYYLIAYGF